MSLYSNFNDKIEKIHTANMLAENILQHTEHRLISFIESTGTQYIDTKYTPSSSTTIEIKYSLTNTANSQGLLSAYKTWTDNSYLLYTYDNVNWTYGGKRAAAPRDTNVHILNLYKGRIIRDGTTVSSITTGTYSGINTSIHLFAGAKPEYYCKMRLYYFKIWDSTGTLIREYLPCVDATGANCLYETFTKTYFYNAGTGVFTAGPMA